VRRYIKPTTLDRAFNTFVQLLTKLGVSVYGSRVLVVRGRKSGEWRTVSANLPTHEGERHLVAPRGETEWVRNLGVAGGGELWRGRMREDFSPSSLPTPRSRRSSGSMPKKGIAARNARV
jgi:hypothetical protein